MSRAERYLIAALLVSLVCAEVYNTIDKQPTLKPAPDGLAETQARLEANRVAYHDLMQQKINDLNHESEMQAIEQVRQEVDNAAAQSRQ